MRWECIFTREPIRVPTLYVELIEGLDRRQDLKA